MTRLDLSKYDGHTPGPWRIHPHANEHDYEIAIGKSFTFKDDGITSAEWICEVEYESVGRSFEYALSDAGLIAAAPDLLAELRRCYAKMDKMKEQIRKAIDCLDTHFGDTGPDYIDYYEQPDLHAMHILLGVDNEGSNQDGKDGWFCESAGCACEDSDPGPCGEGPDPELCKRGYKWNQEQAYLEGVCFDMYYDSMILERKPPEIKNDESEVAK